mgnify:CR=1 FL=1
MEMQYKREEIQEYFNDFIEEQDEEWIEENKDDLHHHAFNTDYFIIGYYQAEQWIGSASNVFDIIETIREYEDMHFGENNRMDVSCPEKVVNMYAYIVGEEVVNEWLEKRELKNSLLNEAEDRGFDRDHLNKHLEVVVVD